jgi:DNA (cytosine-5)-methyltransferase 1
VDNFQSLTSISQTQLNLFEIQEVSPPPVMLWENVPGVLSTKDNAFGCFLAGLAGEECELQPSGKKWTDAGCVYGPKRTVAWRVLDAQYFGLAQRRKRVFVVASSRKDLDPAAILFESDGLRRDIAPRREAGKVAPTIPSRSTAGGGLGTDFDCDGGVITAKLDVDICGTLTAGFGKVGAPEVDAYTCIPAYPINTMIALRHEALGERTGFGIGEPGDPAFTITKGHSHAVAQPMPINTMVALRHNALGRGTGFGIGDEGDPAYTITKGHSHAVAQPVAYGVGESPDTAHCLRSGASKADKHESTTYVAQPFQQTSDCLTAAYGTKWNGNASADNGSLFASHGMAVRRLTPVECERLQGFPDGYTAIPWRKKEASECPDGPRYKALGNSMAVPVMRWIGARIDGAVKQ